MKTFVSCLAALLFTSGQLVAQESKTTELWKPEPKVVTPGATDRLAPSDAIILFDGKGTAAWQQSNGNEPGWLVADSALTAKKGAGSILTRQKFGDCQLHIEWKTPVEIKGDGQARGNSGVFMMGRYELQILDSYNNKTYTNGQAGSIYKQHIPLVNASKGPGEWQSFDIFFTAPRFGENGTLLEPARMTVLQNGVLVQLNAVLWGAVTNVGLPSYQKHDTKEPIQLQEHSDPVSFRNIWVREL